LAFASAAAAAAAGSDEEIRRDGVGEEWRWKGIRSVGREGRGDLNRRRVVVAGFRVSGPAFFVLLSLSPFFSTLLRLVVTIQR
jgi:hypothetical protein